MDLKAPVMMLQRLIFRLTNSAYFKTSALLVTMLQPHILVGAKMPRDPNLLVPKSFTFAERQIRTNGWGVLAIERLLYLSSTERIFWI